LSGKQRRSTKTRTQKIPIGVDTSHGVSHGSASIIDSLAAERRYTGDHDVSPLRGWLDRFASYPMAYAMGYRSAAAPQLRPSN
jgi:hypothetical protein